MKTNRQNTEDFEGSENTLSDITMMTTCHYVLVQTHKMNNIKSEPQDKLWTLVIMICQCNLILGKNCIILMSDADNREDYACREVYGKISVPSSQFYYESKTAVKESLGQQQQKKLVLKSH